MANENNQQTVIDLIHNTTLHFLEQKNENNTFKIVQDDECSDLIPSVSSSWSSLDEHFNALKVDDDKWYELPDDVKKDLQNLIFKPNITIIKEKPNRKESCFSNSSKTKSRKFSMKSKIDLLDKKTEHNADRRKSSASFHSKRKSSQVVRENATKMKDFENNSNRKMFTTSKRDRYSQGDMEMLPCDKRRKSTLSEAKISIKKKKIFSPMVTDYDFKTFVMSPPDYNIFDCKETQTLGNALSWSSKERSRKKVTEWVKENIA